MFKRSRKLALVGAVLLAVVLGAALLGSPLKLAAAPDRYTELYFNRDLSLPKTLNGPITFSFTVHNVEGRHMYYPYTIEYRTATGLRVMDAGTLVIADGATRSVNQTLNLPTGSTEVLVVLPDQQQEIHFWLGTKS